MNILSAISLILLMFVITPAWAETIPESLHGYETSGGEYSQIWMEWNELDLVNATITLPDRNWNAITIPLDITRYSNSDDGMISLFSQINRNAQIIIIGEYIDEDTMLIDARISIEDYDDIIPFQYIANVSSVQYEEPIRLEVRTSELNTIQMGRIASLQVTTHDLNDYNKKYNGIEMVMEISRDDKIITTKKGVTDNYGRWNPEFVVTWPDYYPTFCYDVLVTANYGKYMDTATEDFRTLALGEFGKTELETGYQFDQVKLKSDNNCNEN